MTDHSTTNDAVRSHLTDHAPELRRRAAHLTELAGAIETSLVMTLAEGELTAPATDRRTALGQALVDRSLHQLHRAADDLRVTAMRFRARADELEAAAARSAA